MEALRERIQAEGKMLGEDILKVDSFINHQVDVGLMEEIGQDIAKHFAGQGITKIFTIESSGIAPAVFAAKYMELPLVILKKKSSRTLSQNLWQTEVISYTKDVTVAGLAVLIEKAYQPGRGKLEAQGITVYAQTRIARCGEAGIEFAG